ncbi:MAG: hypothetical protein ACK4RT_12200 [Erythrobacter sp.]
MIVRLTEALSLPLAKVIRYTRCASNGAATTPPASARQASGIRNLFFIDFPSRFGHTETPPSDYRRALSGDLQL